jgi:hypothetical protein
MESYKIQKLNHMIKISRASLKASHKIVANSDL